MLRITDLPGPTLRLEGVLSGPEVTVAAEYLASVLGREARVVVDLQYVKGADREAIRWLRELPRDRVTLIRAPMTIEDLLREERAS